MQKITFPLPVAFSSAVLRYQAATPASVIVAQPGIRNTDSVGVLIDKIVITCGTLADIQLWPVSPIAQRDILIELRWQNELITNGFVSQYAVTWPQNRATESTGPQTATAITLVRPLYLAPNDMISVAIRTDSLVNDTTSYDFRFTAIGRQVAAPPSDVWLPFLSDFRTRSYVPGSNAVISDRSTTANLGNPFDVDLFIERMIGRVIIGTAAARTESDNNPSPVWFNFLIRMMDDRDSAWVPVQTPLPMVFNVVDRSWILNHTMKPKGFVIAEIDGIASGTDPILVNQPMHAVLGMVGYRRFRP